MGKLAWTVFGFAVLSFMVVGAWSTVWTEGPLPPTAQGTPGIPSVEERLDLASIDPRETADNLFNQIVDAAAVGDTMHVYAFLPVAIGAYQEAGPLDPDGLFHVSTLLRIGSRPDEALASAQLILERDPDHILGLGAAAQAAAELGRTDQAAEYYEHLLQVYDDQVERELSEYVGHASLLQRVREDAGSYLRER